jgi:hypothetical protein
MGASPATSRRGIEAPRSNTAPDPAAEASPPIAPASLGAEFPALQSAAATSNTVETPSRTPMPIAKLKPPPWRWAAAAPRDPSGVP